MDAGLCGHAVLGAVPIVATPQALPREWSLDYTRAFWTTVDQNLPAPNIAQNTLPLPLRTIDRERGRMNS